MSKYFPIFSLIAVLSLVTSIPVEATVFVHRGQIDDPLWHDGRAYKEVEIADLNGDGWPDIYAAQKQRVATQCPIVVPGGNIDRVYLNSGTGSISDLTSAFSLQGQPRAFRSVQTVRGYDVEIAD